MMEGLIQAHGRRPGVSACLALLAIAAALLIAFTGCAPPVGDRSDAAVDSVELAHQHARLTAEPEPDPWPDMPDDVRSGIVSDALAGIDPRLSDVEQRLAGVEQRVDKHDGQLDMHINVVTELSQRVSAIENLPQAPAPDYLLKQLEQLEADRESLKALEASADRLAEAITKLEGGGCQCGPDCTCGPDCKCPDGCDPSCPCRRRAQAKPESAEKPYASVTLLSVPGCPPCEQWKQDVLPAVLEKGWAFSEETLTHGTAPQFRICIGDACYLHQGPLTGNDLARIVAVHEGRAEPVSLEGPGFFGDLFGRRGR